MIDNIMNVGGSFIINIILARMLSPDHYGLIGMVYIFTLIANIFISSGLPHSLIRTKDATQADYSTVFFFNIIVCITAYLILFFSAPYISLFFDQPVLVPVVRVLGLSIMINGFSIVQTAIRHKEINYKIQAKISIIGTIAGGAVAIMMAYRGFGVWSLVAKELIRSFATSLLYWITSQWRPAWIFSKEHFKKHWNYGMSLLRNDITMVVFDNLYTFVIGKFYSVALLGQYSRAKDFTDLSSRSIYSVLSNGITFPVLCKVNDNMEELKRLFLKFMKLIIFLSCTSTAFFVAVSDSFIPFVIGNQWIIAVKFVKILSVSAFLLPVNMYNISIAKVIGRPDIFANAILFQRLWMIPAVVIGIFTNIETLLWCTAVTSCFSLLYNSYQVRQILRITMDEQFKLTGKVVAIPLLCASIMYAAKLLMLNIEPGYVLLIQLMVGFSIFFWICQWKKQEEYIELKSILIKELTKMRQK